MGKARWLIVALALAAAIWLLFSTRGAEEPVLPVPADPDSSVPAGSRSPEAVADRQPPTTGAETPGSADERGPPQTERRSIVDVGSDARSRARATGRVVDEQDAPFAGATLQGTFTPFRRARDADRAQDPGLVLDPVSADDGSFTLTWPLLPLEAGELSVVAAAPGRVAASVSVKPGADVTLKLVPGLVVSGEVLRARDDAPVADAAVELRGFPFSRQRSIRCTTSGEGAFRLDGVLPGISGELLVHFEGCVSYSQNVTFPAEGSPPVTIRLPERCARQGRAVDALDGRRLAGADVTISSWDHDVRLATTASDGTFRFEAFRDAAFPVHVALAGYCTTTRNVGADPVDVPLLRAASVEGIARDPRGAPRPGLWVSAQGPPPSAESFATLLGTSWPNDAKITFPECEVVSGPDGTYRIETVAPGTEDLMLCARRSVESVNNARAVGTVGARMPGASTRVDFVWEDGETGRIVGWVTRNGVHGAVNVELEGEDGARIRRTTRSDEKGEFAFEKLSSGSYTLEAEDGGVRGPPKHVKIAQDDAVHVALVLWTREPFLTSGRWLAADGAPVAGTVTLFREDGAFLAMTQPGSDGSFAVSWPGDLPAPGTRARLVCARANRELVLDVAPGAHDLEVRSPADRRIAILLHVHDPTTAIASRVVATHSGTIAGTTVVARGTGWFDVSPEGRVDMAVPPGVFEFVVTEKRGGARSGTLRIAADQPSGSTVDLLLE